MKPNLYNMSYEGFNYLLISKSVDQIEIQEKTEFTLTAIQFCIS